MLRQHSRPVRGLHVLLAGVLMAAVAPLGLSAPAAVSVASTKPISRGPLADGVLIHTNRSYTFVNVPKALHGLDYVLHEHRNPGTLTVTANDSGTLYVCLWEGATLSKAGLSPGDWQTVCKLKVGGASTHPWHVYSTAVVKGQTFTLAALDRWGTVVFAGTVSGPPKAVDVVPVSPHAVRNEFNLLSRQIRRHQTRPPELKAKLSREALRTDALIRDDDRTPVDVVLRRTRALFRHLTTDESPPDLSEEIGRAHV